MFKIKNRTQNTRHLTRLVLIHTSKDINFKPKHVTKHIGPGPCLPNKRKEGNQHKTFNDASLSVKTNLEMSG